MDELRTKIEERVVFHIRIKLWGHEWISAGHWDSEADANVERIEFERLAQEQIEAKEKLQNKT